MPARYDRRRPVAVFAAALLAGTALLALPPAASPAKAQEDQSAHHPGVQAEAQESEHSGHSGMGMMEGGMHGDDMKGMMQGGMQGSGMQGMMKGEMGGGHEGMGGGHEGMGGSHEGMSGHEDMKGTDMRAKMRHMMHEMMTKMATHADERIASLKDELKITEAQLPQWTAFADTLRAAAKAMEQMHKDMMPASPAAAAPAPSPGATTAPGATDYPDYGAIKKVETPAPAETHPAHHAKSLPERVEGLEKRLTQHLDNLKAIKAALDPLYATFDENQKKIADGLMVGPMGVM